MLLVVVDRVLGEDLDEMPELGPTTPIPMSKQDAPMVHTQGRPCCLINSERFTTIWW